jgi:hypothetical protein
MKARYGSLVLSGLIVIAPAEAGNGEDHSAPQPDLWHTTLKAPEKGVTGVYHSMPCAEGETFTGEAYVQIAHLSRGKAQLGIVFQGGGKALRYGGPLGPGLPNETAAPGRVHLGVKGAAPPGTDTVQFYLQTFGCNPGAQATFDSVVFRRLASGEAGPNLWKTTLKAPANGIAGDYLPHLPCRQGDEFTGEAFVQTRGLDKGSARIGVAFYAGGKPIRYGGALGGGVDFSSMCRSSAPTRGPWPPSTRSASGRSRRQPRRPARPRGRP